MFHQVESHRKAAAATASGKFKDEIIPVKTKVPSLGFSLVALSSLSLLSLLSLSLVLVLNSNLQLLEFHLVLIFSLLK